MFTGEIKTAVDRAVLCWLATVDANGQPNVSPKEIFCTASDTELMIAEIASPVSHRNIGQNSKVCVSFVDVFRQKGYKVHGDARLIPADTPEYDDRAGPLIAMAGPNFKVRSIILVDAIRVAPIVAPSYAKFPDTTEAQKIRESFKTYGVRAVD